MSTYEGIDQDNIHLDTKYLKANEFREDYHLGQANSLSKLRQTSQHIIRNHHVGAAAQQAYIDDIVSGAVRIKAKATNAKYQKMVDAILQSDAKFDVAGTRTLTDEAEEIIGAAFADGDVLLSLTEGALLDIVEASRVETPPSKRMDTNVINGVVFENKREVGYYVNKNTMDHSSSRKGISDEDYQYIRKYDKYGTEIAILFRAPIRARANMVRVPPVLTPCFVPINYCNSVLQAVLIGLRVSTCHVGYIETANTAGMTGAIGGKSVEGSTTKQSKLMPGIVGVLKKGEKIVFNSPPRQSDQFDLLLVRMYRFIAASLRCSYEQLFMDLSITNLATWRGGSIERKKNRIRWRRVLSSAMKWHVTAILQENGVDMDKIKYLSVSFPNSDSPNPEEDARAIKIKMANGVMSKRMAADSANIDYDELEEEIEQEKTDTMVFDTELEAEKLKLIKALEEKFGIEFTPDDNTGTSANGTSKGGSKDYVTEKRPGEAAGTQLDDEDALERRKEDGNM